MNKTPFNTNMNENIKADGFKTYTEFAIKKRSVFTPKNIDNSTTKSTNPSTSKFNFNKQ